MPEMGTTEPTPNLEELLQEEVSYPTVPVRGEGSFLVQQLPARRVQYATDLIGADWVPLLPETPKRARVVLTSDQPFYVSSSAMGSGMRVPANTPYVATHCRPIYARSAGEPGVPAPLSVVPVQTPAAGVNWSYTVPAGQALDLGSVRFTLATSAVVAARIPELVIEDPTGIAVVTVSALSSLAASTSRVFNFFPGASAGGAGVSSMSLPAFRLYPGWKLRGNVFALDAADQVSSIFLAAQVATIGPALIGSAVELWAD